MKEPSKCIGLLGKIFGHNIDHITTITETPIASASASCVMSSEDVRDIISEIVTNSVDCDTVSCIENLHPPVAKISRVIYHGSVCLRCGMTLNTPPDETKNTMSEASSVS